MEERWRCLVEWLRDKDCCIPQLRLENFSTTGRGLAANKDFKEGETLLEIPTTVMITSELSELIKKCQVFNIDTSIWMSVIRSLSSFQRLLIRTVIEIQQRNFSYYAETFPTTLNFVPIGSVLDISGLSPRGQALLSSRRADYLKDISVVQRLCGYFSLPSDLVEYIWLVVNTRCASLNHTDIALIPFFDMLNHSPDVKNRTEFDGNYFRLITETSFSKDDQVYICYGAHDSEKMFIEYGFAPSLNKFHFIDLGHSVIQAYSKMKDYDCAVANFLQSSSLELKYWLEDEDIPWNLALLVNLLPTRPSVSQVQRCLKCGFLPDKRLLDCDVSRRREFIQNLIIMYDRDLQNRRKQLMERPHDVLTEALQCCLATECAIFSHFVSLSVKIYEF